jgi:hypothetical protein
VKKVFGILFVLVLVLSLVGFAVQALAAPDNDGDPKPPGPPIYPGYTGDPWTRNPMELITQPYFGNEWVNTLPYDPSVPSPYEHHGYIAGSPAQLTPYWGPNGTYDYFKTLAKASPRVKMWDIGTTRGFGFPIYIVAISDADTIARLDEYQKNLQLLADPRKLGYPENEAAADAAAEKLITNAAKLKPIFWVTAKLHSDESGSSEMTMELAFRLAVEKSPMYDEIRKNLIVFITDPNPDGTQLVADWDNYYYLVDKSYGEPTGPFYNWYDQHDNNRETIINSQPENKAIVKAVNQWPAQVWLDIHEAMFLAYTFAGMEPSNPFIDPITQTEWQWYASRELNQAEAFGMPGIWTYQYVNMYYPYYGIQILHFHNGVGKFYEIYGHGYPDTIHRTSPWPSPTSTSNWGARWQWFSPKPYPYSDVWWSFRNDINESETMALTTCLTMAHNRETVLRNYWIKAKNAVSAPGTLIYGSSSGDSNNPTFTYPYAYVVPAGQEDMPDTVNMINNLLLNGVEVSTANSAFTVTSAKALALPPEDQASPSGGSTMTYPAGSFIINMAQPYSRTAAVVFEPQIWPADMPAWATPYDSTAWQYGYIRDVAVDRIDDPAILNVPSTLITAEQIAYLYTVSGQISTGYYVIDHNSINNIVNLVFDLAAGGYTCYAAEGSEGVIDVGDVLVPAEQAGVYDFLKSEVAKLGLTMYSVAGTTVAMHELNAPRVAVYHDWRSIQAGGWSRATFDAFNIPYTLIQKDEVNAGNLKSKYDVIFLPNSSDSAMRAGVVSGPPSVTEGPVLTDNRIGGFGTGSPAPGIDALRAFVQDGGLLICNLASTDLPINEGFVTGITRSTVSSGSAGPMVRILPNLTNPVCYGVDAQESIYIANPPTFTVTNPAATVLATYSTDTRTLLPENGSQIYLSGLFSNPSVLAGKAAMVEAPVVGGTGRVVLFGFDITYRMQAYGSYIYLWNAILNWDDLP